MRLRDRLGARRSGAVPGPGAPVGKRVGEGWGTTRWTAPVGTPLVAVLGPHAVPRGMETLAVPDEAAVATAVRALEGPAATAAVDAQRPVVVLDIETSGLGASLVPFMVALAWHERGRVHLMQWTLHDPGAERAFLGEVFACLDGALRPGTRLLSFNGKSFDLPRLRVRAQRLALGAGVPSQAHLDLMIPARRVLKGSLPNCRLTTLEAELLGHRRRCDMGGMEIAELWERMVATPGLASALARAVGRGVEEAGGDDPLDPFLREDLAAAQLHNRGDVWALCSVATAVAGRLEQPRCLAEAMGAATHLRQIEATTAAAAVLRPFVEEGGRPKAEVWVEAALLLAEIHRGAGEHAAAAALWRRVCEASPGHVRAHDALAKHLEHKERRPDLALAVAERSVAPCPRRIARLQKKAEAARA